MNCIFALKKIVKVLYLLQSPIEPSPCLVQELLQDVHTSVQDNTYTGIKHNYINNDEETVDAFAIADKIPTMMVQLIK